MSEIPHADGPYSDITKYGVAKATALEALRKTLDTYDGGWISAVGSCALRLVNGKETCLIRVITSTGGQYSSSVTLTRSVNEVGFPFSDVDVEARGEDIDEIGVRQSFDINEFTGHMCPVF